MQGVTCPKSVTYVCAPTNTNQFIDSLPKKFESVDCRQLTNRHSSRTTREIVGIEKHLQTYADASKTWRTNHTCLIRPKQENANAEPTRGQWPIEYLSSPNQFPDLYQHINNIL